MVIAYTVTDSFGKDVFHVFKMLNLENVQTQSHKLYVTRISGVVTN